MLDLHEFLLELYIPHEIGLAHTGKNFLLHMVYERSYTYKLTQLRREANKRAMMALGRSPEYHWDQIISKSVHRFSRRSRLKLFSIYSPEGHFVQQSGMV